MMEVSDELTLYDELIVILRTASDIHKRASLRPPRTCSSVCCPTTWDDKVSSRVHAFSTDMCSSACSGEIMELPVSGEAPCMFHVTVRAKGKGACVLEQHNIDVPRWEGGPQCSRGYVKFQHGSPFDGFIFYREAGGAPSPPARRGG